MMVDLTVAAYRQTHDLRWLAWSEGWWPPGSVLHILGELVEVLQMTYCNDSAINVCLECCYRQRKVVLPSVYVRVCLFVSPLAALHKNYLSDLACHFYQTCIFRQGRLD